jgi:glycosyltransferase involved in cell wall biosynthesis
MKGETLRLAVFGLRQMPPGKGSAGVDTIATELYPRLAERGHEITVYCRRYTWTEGVPLPEYKGVKLVHFRTVSKSGFDTLIHSFLSTMHIIFRNTAHVVHVQNGGNSIWAIPLRLCGKRVCVSQDGVDWDREKWKWYARLYLRLSAYLTGYLPNSLVFDNIFTKELFEKKFGRKYIYIPWGSDFAEPKSSLALQKYGLQQGGYFLFIGRFIPEKGIHYLLEAFREVTTDKKLVIIGGSPNPNLAYEQKIRSMADARVQFLGFVYGEEMLEIMRSCYCYVQPSDIEGLSPVVLTAMGMGVPILCSNIPENIFAVKDTALLFEKSSVESLRTRLREALSSEKQLRELAQKARERARRLFSWDGVADAYEQVYRGDTLEPPPGESEHAEDH